MNKEINIRQKIYLGALLHDIGKFYQRADKRFYDKYNELSQYSKNIAEDICPKNDYRRFGYQHVIWTNEFFGRFYKKFQQIPGVKENLYTNPNIDNITTFACNHHKPQTLLQSFITIGDWWSAGIDRGEQTTFEKEEIKNEKGIIWGRERYKTIPLFSVFNEINSNRDIGQKVNGHKNAFGLNILSIKKEDIFTKNIAKKEDGVSEELYKKLWGKFAEEFEKLPTDSVDGFTESLLYLLKKYTWCIPSNTMDMANVNLFEHLKTTAAFADSIYTFYSDNNEDKFSFDKSNNRLSLNENVHPVMLVGGDVSGIQKFIYNIASQKAAVSLKGRSFYLQLLIDSIIQKIITHNDIQATIGHVVYSSGGKFYMILPNTEKVKLALKSIKEEIETELWKKHKGKLSVNLSTIAFSLVKDTENKISIEGEKENKNLGDLWRSLAEKLNTQKNQKFKSLLNDAFFEKQEVGGDIKICSVSGEELESKERNVDKENLLGLSNKILKEENIYLSYAVKEQTKIGIALKDVDYIITYRNPNDENKYLSKKSKANINTVGVDNYMFNEEELTKDDADFRSITSADVSRIMLFNNTNPLLAKLKGNAVSYGFQFYGGNKQAELLGNNKTFEQLTRVKEDDKDTETYLGVLRMDVDGLGNIFIKGLDEKDKSFAAYATMSFQLDLFFSGYLNTIRKNDKFKDFVNILYSGGDDVFAVGRWDKLIDFADEIRTEFAAFIGRGDITISGGIAIVRNKYPIAKAAELAGEAEEASKHFNNDEKNAISFLGETISWKKEFIEVKKCKDEFVRLCLNGMPSSLLHKIMEFYQIKKEGKDLSYVWNTAYYLKRFADRNEKNPETKHMANRLQNELFNGNRAFGKIALAARWAELQIREIDS
ncbi:MAG: type III-A CRISPR-associated protein Cas10/Csm1 [Bacteroidota bacterium]|nr:type III-A CRISPR-associated protein Cas10/Csm1 [Bacteroidota bacterium]